MNPIGIQQIPLARQLPLSRTEPETEMQGANRDEGTPLYILPLPESFRSEVDDAGLLHNWLTSQGIEVTSVSIGTELVYIEASTDPSAVLAGYVTEPNRTEQLKAELESLDLEEIEHLKAAVGILTQLVANG